MQGADRPNFEVFFRCRYAAAMAHAPPAPPGPDPRSHWGLDPGTVFLNHGSFGATPLAVLEAQAACRRRLEANPVAFLDRGLEAEQTRAKAAVGRFLGARPEDFGFVTNATAGINAVLRSLPFAPGDELLTTDHVYGAVRRTLEFVAGRTGATVIEAPVPLPLVSADAVTDALDHAMSERTRLVVIDHVTSPTALVFPAKRIADLCAERGVELLVDGAHAPGMIDLDIARLGATYYAGNLHKWVCAPKGAGYLWVAPRRQADIHPGTISHHLGEGLVWEFGWQGTRDVTPWLCAPDAIDFMERTFGWDAVRRHNHDLAAWVQALLCGRWGVEAGSPADGGLLGAMVTVPLPGDPTGQFETDRALQARLFEQYRIEIPVMEWSDRWWIRASCQVYNTPDQYETLADAVMELIAC
jgi:isopenicillin-N epimerase